ncbi:hypothetical protein ACQPYK_33330 [Streptosporangium sp. CA-135522]|uniref:hypothetical protein n=1 Tax=Streptosporangium sp. CA-135522 TaxID=3240072 RepID=UPI003D89EE3C
MVGPYDEHQGDRDQFLAGYAGLGVATRLVTARVALLGFAVAVLAVIAAVTGRLLSRTTDAS